jgi:radical SAM protein with 4Fe4S-binding SPASM domain
MPTGRIFEIVDEIAEAGCLEMLITGGEPLMHKDFSEIYRYMKLKGLLVTVFTNGTLISDEIAALFAELPPYAVEISLYGATDATSDRITGVESSMSRCLEGVKKLTRHGVKNVRLKTMLMTVNSHEYYDMERLAEEMGLKWRMDAVINPRINGDAGPLALRVSPEEAIEKEYSSESRLSDMKKYFERCADLPASDQLYVCGAGECGFHIDAYGNLRPCLMTEGIKYRLEKGNFLDSWQRVIRDILNKKARQDNPCRGCKYVALCGCCPAVSVLETGDEQQPSGYMCEIGKRRFDAITRTG